MKFLLMQVFTRVRAVIGGLSGVITTMFWSIIAMIYMALGGRRWIIWIIQHWSKGLLFIFGIGVDVKGEEKIPKTGGGVMVFNHQSHFDIPLLFISTKKDIRFGAKIELFSVPFFGPAMRRVGTLPIVRDNRKEVLRVYKEAAKAFQQNVIYVLAPEGTRQKEPQIGRFKKGPFLFAVEAGVPIIPVVIKGAYEVLPKQSVLVNVGKWHTAVKIEFLDPIPTTGMDPANLDALTEKTRSVMVAKYAEMKI